MKDKTRLSTKKRLATVFLNWRGILVVNFLPDRQAVNAACYRQLQDSEKAAYRSKRGNQLIREVILRHDNARSHTAVLTLDKLNQIHWETLEYPP